MLGEFYIGELGAVFIFAIAGVGLMLLVGYTGLISLGHAAFLGIGAYVNAVLLAQGVPFLVTLPVAGLFTALCGAAIGRPTLRMSGLYLAIATLAFGSIVGTVFQKWTAVTGGFDGFAVPTPYDLRHPDRGRHRHLLRLAAWCWCSCCGSRPTCCARRSAARWWRSATARSRRRAWASTWRGTRRWRSPSAPA